MEIINAEITGAAFLVSLSDGTNRHICLTKKMEKEVLFFIQELNSGCLKLSASTYPQIEIKKIEITNGKEKTS